MAIPHVRAGARKEPVNLGHKHSAEIVPSDDITVNLDYRQMGVAGDDSWGAPVHKEFTLPAAALRVQVPHRACEGALSKERVRGAACVALFGNFAVLDPAHCSACCRG